MAGRAEASAYFIVAEALTNVVKHSHATRAEVSASVDDGSLRIDIRDDGSGGADPAGHGLVGMNDRVTALGGRLQNMRSRTYTLLSIAVVAAVLAAGCDGGGSGPSAGAAPSAGGSSRTSAITISNFKFSPGTLRVQDGAGITVANDDSTAHTVTADDGHSFDSRTVDSGASTTIRAPAAGTYAYHCTIHPFMKGKLVVQ